MGNLITTDDVRTILQITDSGSDAFITKMIPIVQGQALQYCNLDINVFSGSTNSEGIQQPLSNMIKFQLDKPSGVTSETYTNYAVTYTQDYPKHIYSQLNRFRIMGFVTSSWNYGPYSEYWKQYVVKYWERDLGNQGDY